MSSVKFLLGICLCCSVLCSAFETRNVYNPTTKEHYLEVENENFILDFFALGGRIKRLYFKPAKADLTETNLLGTATENIWNVPASRYFLRERPFDLKTYEKGSNFTVEATGNHQGGEIDFLRVTKRYTISKENALLTIDYEFENLPEAMAKVNYAILIHNNLGLLDEPCSYFIPSKEGIKVVRPEKRPQDLWTYHPARGWMAAAAKSGRGIAVTMSYPELSAFYNWFSTDLVPTMEWRMVPIGIESGKKYQTQVTMIPFTGICEVAGAGGGLVGEIAVSKKDPEPGEKVGIEVKVYNARKGKIEAELKMRHAPSGPWEGLQKAELEYSRPGMVQNFHSELTSDTEELIELEVILRKDAAELARLNSTVNFGESETPWTIAPLEKTLESSIEPPDLTRFTHITDTPHIKWAKPLPGNPLKMLVLTEFTSIPEVSQLAQRLDTKFAMTYLCLDFGKKRKLGDVQYSLGDYAGVLTINDMEENLQKVLRGKYDVILLAFPFEALPETARKQLLEQVQTGTGLVCVGPENGADFLGVEGQYPTTVSEVTSPIIHSFITEGIPFDALGSEPVYRYTAKGTVHAQAGTLPWLVETVYGKGKVFTLTYRATFGRFDNSPGLTPNLADLYETHNSPHEFYYLLLAKCLFSAAGRVAPVIFEPPRIIPGKAEFAVRSAVECDTEWECFVLNRFQEVQYSLKFKAALPAGDRKVEVKLPSLPYAGIQTLSVIVRNGKGEVLNSGAWSFSEPPTAEILSLTTDRNSYENGDSVKFKVSLKGNLAGQTLKAELIDSFDRVIAMQTFQAETETEASVKLENTLCSRFSKLKVSVCRDGRESDRRYAFLAVRPSEESLAWDDFETGTWFSSNGTRFYLWKEQAKVFENMKIRTLISNWTPTGITFAVRHNFHPTLLTGCGLNKCPEPVEYTKTGDKKYLVRTPCLSEQKMIDETAHSFDSISSHFRKYALRFVWLGDEQSLTGFGGSPIDFCFSDACLIQFREFLKKRYSTLETLNREWNTDFLSWENVVPFTRQEVIQSKGKLVAGWADHLEFMDGRLENIVSIALETGRKNDPLFKLAACGTQPPTAYGGMDWWKQMKLYDVLLNYSAGGQDEIQRSFSIDRTFMPWRLGYSIKAPDAVYYPWNTLFQGFRGIMYFHNHSMINPDWTLSIGAADALPHLKRISEGTGKYVINVLKSSPEVAVLYSQASIRAAFIEDRRDEHAKLRMKIIKLLRNTGTDFNFISYEQLANGVLEKSPYKLLILPDSTALSNQEVDAIQKFVMQGGKIFAEATPGTRYANCRQRPEPALQGLFIEKGNTLIPKINFAYLDAIEFPGVAENTKCIEEEQERLHAALVSAGINLESPQITVNGERQLDIDIYPRKDSSGNLFFGILTGQKAQRMTQFVFPHKAHIYNLINGRYYGFTDTLLLPFDKGTPYGFLLMKVKIDSLKMHAENACVSVEVAPAVNTVVRLQVFAPDGTEKEYYASNLLIEQGHGQYAIPFALSDKHGEWEITATDVLSGQTSETTVMR